MEKTAQNSRIIRRYKTWRTWKQAQQSQLEQMTTKQKHLRGRSGQNRTRSTGKGKKKYEVPTPDPLAEREKELNARETKLNIKELINGEGYPKELANTLKYNSFEEFKDQVESLKEMGLLNTVSTKASYRVSTSTKQGNGSSNSFCTTEDEDIRKAMKLR